MKAVENSFLIFCIIIIIIINLSILSACSKPMFESPGPGEVDHALFEHDITNDYYTLGPGDEIIISVLWEDDLRQTLQVDPSGFIHFQPAGPIKASGLTTQEVSCQIGDKISRYYRNPEVSVTVSRTDSLNFFVLGEVIQPGKITPGKNVTVLEALSEAGGLTKDADSSKVVLIRQVNNQTLLKPVDLETGKGYGIRLKRGDAVYAATSRIADAERFVERVQSFLTLLITGQRSVILSDQIYRIFRGETEEETIVISP